MNVGVLKEIKDNENRVALTPEGVRALFQRGHQVFVESDAGLGSGLTDEEYQQAGATVLPDARNVWDEADMVLKVKEPLPAEYSLIKPGQIIFTYFHFAASRELTDAMLKSQAVCIAYETVEDEKGRLPLLKPMSEVAGRMSVLIGSYYLAKFAGGKGVLINGTETCPAANVAIVGGGVVGENAALSACGIGANTTILELSDARMAWLKDKFPSAKVVKSTKEAIAQAVKQADLVVGAVLVAGAKAPKLVTKEMIESMKPGSVIVDVAIDQGGCIETSHVTSHSNPVYVHAGVTHYCVGNMPGAYPRTSTYALTYATLPYALQLADKGLGALQAFPGLRKGLNVCKGSVTNQGVAAAFGLPFTEAEGLLGLNNPAESNRPAKRH